MLDNLALKAAFFITTSLNLDHRYSLLSFVLHPNRLYKTFIECFKLNKRTTVNYSGTKIQYHIVNFKILGTLLNQNWLF